MKTRRNHLKSTFRKKLIHLSKKDRKTYAILLAKMHEILSCKDVNHYKNLRKPMQKFKRIRIRRSLVLLFKYSASEDSVTFWDLEHHDRVYAAK